MSIVINKLRINQYATELEIDIETTVGYNIEAITVKTKDLINEEYIIDLSSKIDGSTNNETITLLPSDLDLESFEGVFLFNFISNEIYDEFVIGSEINNVYGMICNVSNLHYYISKKLTLEEYDKDLEQLNLIVYNIYSSIKLDMHNNAFILYNSFLNLIEDCNLLTIQSDLRVNCGLYIENDMLIYT